MIKRALSQQFLQTPEINASFAQKNFKFIATKIYTLGQVSNKTKILNPG